MSTDTKPHTVHVADVKRALDTVVAASPERTDRRIEDHLNPRYLDRGVPTCLVAKILIELGFRITLLQDLDREHRIGHIANAGVRIAESRHPALRRLHPPARALLAHLQAMQDRGLCWDVIVEQAFRPKSMWRSTRSDKEERPWLY